jgi:hypothetical protein
MLSGSLRHNLLKQHAFQNGGYDKANTHLKFWGALRSFVAAATRLWWALPAAYALNRTLSESDPP